MMLTENILEGFTYLEAIELMYQAKTNDNE